MVFVSLSLGVWILSKAEDLPKDQKLPEEEEHWRGTKSGLVLLQCSQIVADQRFARAAVDSMVPRFQLLIMHEDCSVRGGCVSTCVAVRYCWWKPHFGHLTLS